MVEDEEEGSVYIENKWNKYWIYRIIWNWFRV